MRIDHRENNRTGSALGEGLYFTDQFHKAFAYSRNDAYDSYSAVTNKASKLVLICQVALGKEFKTTQYQQLKYLDKKFSSVVLEARSVPDKTKDVMMEDGFTIPQGQVVDSYGGSYVDASEYCIYRPRQVKLMYVVQIRKGKKKVKAPKKIQ